MLNKFTKNDTGSSTILYHGYHVIPKKISTLIKIKRVVLIELEIFKEC